MANPRQRRKAKSSTHKAISHSKRAKKLQKKMPAVRGPKALQDAWDPSKTVRQNYLALGLEHDLDPISSGGTEVNLTRPIDPINTRPSHSTTLSSANGDARSSVPKGPTVSSVLPKGFGRIIRDASGGVVRVELPSDKEEGHFPKQELVIDTPVMMSESEVRTWAHNHPKTHPEAGSGWMERKVIQDLEDLAASAAVRARHASTGERLYLEHLVNKYGDDLHRMARDRRLNPDQRTANELKRAIAKAGGFGTLYKSTVTNVSE